MKMRGAAFRVAAVVGALTSCASAFAGAEAEGMAHRMRAGMSGLDWAVVVLYAIGMLAVGVYYSFRTRTSEEYYLGGRRMRPSMVGLSLFATMVSTITYLAIPGEMIQHGPVYLVVIAGIPITFLIVGYGLIPYIMRLPITSGYEILENRFGRPVRLLGSLIFLSIRFIWMSVVIFTCSKVVVTAVGLDPAATKYIAASLGIVTVVYASLGGLRAVVLTDVIQTGILFTGAILTIVLVSVKMGGVGWFPTEWSENWDVQPFISFDPRVRVTVVGTVVSTISWWICTAGSDQMAIQRYLATRDARSARRMFLVSNCTEAMVSVLLALLGFALLGFFTAHPECIPGHMSLDKDASFLFPHFIVSFVGYGMAGLVISGMLAAAMSSLSSGLNSTCTVINTDIIAYLRGADLPEKAKVATARLSSFIIGGVVVALSLLIQRVPGNLLEVTSKTSNLFVAPLFGLFFFALFVPFATGLGASLGSLYGVLAAFLISFVDIAGGPKLSWQWILPVAILVDIVTGSLFSLIPTRGRSVRYHVVVGLVCAVPFMLAMWVFFAKWRMQG